MDKLLIKPHKLGRQVDADSKRMDKSPLGHPAVRRSVRARVTKRSPLTPILAAAPDETAPQASQSDLAFEQPSHTPRPTIGRVTGTAAREAHNFSDRETSARTQGLTPTVARMAH